MHAGFFFWNIVGFTTLRFGFLKAGALLCSFLARHCRLHWNFQLSPCVFDGFFIFSIFGTEEVHAFQSSSIVRGVASRLPILASPFSERLVPFWTKLQATNSRPGSCLNFCLSPPGPHESLWRFFLQMSELCESFPRI